MKDLDKHFFQISKEPIDLKDYINYELGFRGCFPDDLYIAKFRPIRTLFREVYLRSINSQKFNIK